MGLLLLFDFSFTVRLFAIMCFLHDLHDNHDNLDTFVLCPTKRIRYSHKGE